MTSTTNTSQKEAADAAREDVHRASFEQALIWLDRGSRVSTYVEGKRITLLSRWGPFLRYSTPKGRGWTTRRRLRGRLEAMPAWEVPPLGETIERMKSEAGQKPLSPLSRTLRMLQMERGDLTVVVLYGVTIGFLSLSVPIAAQSLVNTVAFGTLLQPIFVLAVLLGLSLVGGAVLRALQLKVVETLQRRLFARVVEHLATSIPRVVPQVWTEKHGPELLNRFFDLFTIQKAAATLLLDATDAILVSLVGLTLLAFYHPALMAFDVFLILAALIIFWPLGRKGIKTAVYESKSKYAVAGWLEDITRHPLAFRQGQGPEFVQNRARTLAQEYLDNREKHFRIVFRQFFWALMLQVLASVLLLGLGGVLVIQRQLTIGQLVAAELIVSAVVASFAKLGSKIETYYDLVAAVDKVGQLIDLPTEDPRGDENVGSASESGLVIDGFEGSGSGCTLRLSVGRGQLVLVENLVDRDAVQLTNTLFGFARLSQGTIRLSGYDLRDLSLETLRKRLALVRRPELVGGSLLENLRIGAPELSRADARRYLDAVAFPSSLLEKEGLDTRVHEDGSFPSTTLAMQIAIARSLALSPEVVVLDRCLDAVPREDREKILSALRSYPHAGFLVLRRGSELETYRPRVQEEISP